MNTEILKSTKSQERAIERIEREVLQYTIGNSPEIIDRFEVEPTDYGTVWVRVQTKRTDCDEFSPRNVYCSHSGFFKVGKKGKVTPMEFSGGSRKKALRSPVIFGMNSVGQETKTWN